MCACGCFLIAGIIAALVYCVIHALWIPAAVVVIFAAGIGWLGKKAAGSRKPTG
jgi:hypothetical protein